MSQQQPIAHSAHSNARRLTLTVTGRAPGYRTKYWYAQRCRQGETTIWSLRLRVDGQEKRMATIEVNPRKRTIIQARAKCNLRPGGRSYEIMRQWAAAAGLHLQPGL